MVDRHFRMKLGNLPTVMDFFYSDDQYFHGDSKATVMISTKFILPETL